MNFGMWDTLYNLVLLLFWSRIWLTDERDLVTNRYLAGFGRIQSKSIDFIRPVLPFLGPRTIALAALVVLIAFRGLAVPNDAQWSLSFGFVLGQAKGSSIPSCMIFSTLSFVLFLFKLWGISLIFVRTRQQSQFQSSTDALYQLSRPFTDLEPIYRPLLLLAFGTVAGFLLTSLGGSNMAPGPGLVHALRMVILALSGWVALLPVVQQLLFLVLIGSWVSSFMGAPSLATFCRDWIDTLIGPMRRFPIRIGMLDLTPLVFMFALGYVHILLQGVLLSAFQNLG